MTYIKWKENNKIETLGLYNIQAIQVITMDLNRDITHLRNSVETTDWRDN